MQFYVQIKLSLIALLSIAAFMSAPPYRVLALGSVLMLAVLLPGLSSRANRWLLASAFVGAGLYGFVIGQRYWHETQLTGDGIFFLLPLIPALGVVLLRIWVVERDAA